VHDYSDLCIACCTVAAVSELPEEAPPTEGALLNAEEAAERAGVKRGTWSAYVARERAPLPDERDLRTGAPLWRESTVDVWKASRPGQGKGGGRPRRES
jgi:predicted DNA-binding transcriptional regulator AlpA